MKITKLKNTYDKVRILADLTIKNIILQPSLVIFLISLYFAIFSIKCITIIYGSNSYTVLTHIVLYLYFTIQIFTNWLACAVVDTSISSDDDLCYLSSDNRRYTYLKCRQCNKLHRKKEDRLFYCKACKKCIVKRCHHCILLGKCVGHRNQQYFVFSQIWLIIAAFHVLSLQFRYYLFFENRNFQLLDIVRISPIATIYLLWHGAFPSFWQIWIRYSIMVNLVIISVCVAFTGTQLYIIYTDQTEYQLKNGLRGPLSQEHYSIKFRYVFGSHFISKLLWPKQAIEVISSRLSHGADPMSIEQYDKMHIEQYNKMPTEQPSKMLIEQPSKMPIEQPSNMPIEQSNKMKMDQSDKMS